jgi:anti-sigma B factor antagonist
MSLALDSRYCGSVYVVRCGGRIVYGEESKLLDETLQRGLREFTRVVVNVADVSRIDSAGMGLLVRYLWHTRNRRGDLRLAAPSAVVTSLLQITKLATVFKVYPDEESAIVSFLREGVHAPTQAENTGPRVLFLDPSPDTCAFVRALLARHGYRVLSTGLMGDAKILLSASTVDVIVLGPDTGALASPATLDVLHQLAPRAKAVVLQRDFKSRSAEQAGIDLLDSIRAHAGDLAKS